MIFYKDADDVFFNFVVLKSTTMITRLSLCALLLTGATTNTSLKKTNITMDTAQQHKAIIIQFYEQLNHRQLEQAALLAAEDYANNQGGRGPAGFMAQVPQVLQAFPDAQWTLLSVAADGDKVFVRQQMRGTHEGVFQGIAPTHKAVINDGAAIYTFKGGKIIHHEVLTDRLGFLQQLGVLPVDITPSATRNEERAVYQAGN